MPRNPARIPGPFSQRSAALSSNLFSAGGKEVDVAIGGIPFLLATMTDLPQSVESAPIQKEQFDSENEPGEQSLSGWWRRSQDSWHDGAGNLYQESRLTDVPSSGFFDSVSIDPWTHNQLKLIRRTVSHNTGNGLSRLRTYRSPGSTVDKVSVVAGANGLRAFDAYNGTLSTIHDLGASSVCDGFISGATYYLVATDTANVYQGTVGGGAPTSWPLTGAGSADKRLAFGKHRLWVIEGRTIWQPDLSTAGGTAQAAIFTHPNAGWTYTCMAEGPQAMYFGGHDGRTSSIQAIALDAGGGIPTLSGAQVTVRLPDNELVQEIVSLAGQFIGIGTNKGFRVGTFDGSNILYGPILFEPHGTSVTSCSAIATIDRFFLVAFNGATGSESLYKIDTSREIAEGVFPYARDAKLPDGSGYINSIGVAGDQVLVTTSAGAYFYQHPTELESLGWITTGRIRFRTTEKKLFKTLALETEPMSGQLVLDGIEENDTMFDIGVLGDPGVPGSGSIGLPSALGPQRQIALKMTFSRSAVDLSQGPVVNSYLFKALPSVPAQRIITLPLLCFDFEQARSGQRYGFEGWAVERVQALRELEDFGDTVTYQDFSHLTPTGETVVIDQARFIQTAPSKVHSGTSGPGGLLILQLRTVT